MTLGKNEGTIVDKGEKPMAKRAVLPPPTLLTPANNGPVYITTPELTWAPVDEIGRLLARGIVRPELRPHRGEPVRPRAAKHVMAAARRRRVFLARLGARRLRPARRAERGLGASP